MWWKRKKKWWWNLTKLGAREIFIGYDATEVREKIQNRNQTDWTYNMSVRSDGSIIVDNVYIQGRYVMDPDMSVRWVPYHRSWGVMLTPEGAKYFTS